MPNDSSNSRKGKSNFAPKTGYTHKNQQIDFVDEYSFAQTQLDSQDLLKVNTFIACFNAGERISMSSRVSNFSISTFGSFCEILITKKIYGPFLLILPPELVKMWFDAISQSKIITTVLYNAPPEKRNQISNDFYKKDGSYTFHLLITTSDIYREDINKFKSMNFAFSLINRNDDQQQIEVNSHSIIFNQFESFGRYTIETHKMISTINRLTLPSEEKDKIYFVQKQFQLFFPSYDTENLLLESPTIKYVNCPLTQTQRMSIKNLLYQHTNDIKGNNFKILRREIERVCHHPYLIFGNELTYKENIIEASSKIQTLNEIIANHHSHVLIVSDYIKMLDIVEDFLLTTDHAYTRDKFSNGIILMHIRDFSLQEMIEKSETIIFTDVFVDGIKGNKHLIRLTCDDLTESNWEHIKDEQLCKFASIKAFINIDSKSSFTETSQPTELSDSFLSLAEMDNFWEIFLESDLNDENTAEEHQPIKKLSIRQRNQFIRCIFNFYWNRWEYVRKYTGLNLSDDDLRTVADIIIRKIYNLSQHQGNYFAVSDILRNEATDESLIDFDDKIIPYLRSNADNFLNRLQILRFFEIASKAEITTEFQIPDDMKEVWWTKDHSMAMVKFVANHGFSEFDDIDLENTDIYNYISENITTIKDVIDFVVLNTDQASKICETPYVVEYFFVNDEFKSKWNKEDITKVVKFLFNHGIPIDKDGSEDYNAFHEKLKIENKSAEDIQAIVKNMIDNATAKSNIEIFHDHTEDFIEHITTMKELHFIINGRTDEEILFILHRTKKWSQLPKLFNSQIEMKFFKLLFQGGFDALPEISRDPDILAAFGKTKPSALTKFTKVSARIHLIAGSIRLGKEITEDVVNQYIKRSRKGTSDDQNSAQEPNSSPKPKSRSKPKPKPEDKPQEQQKEEEKQNQSDDHSPKPNQQQKSSAPSTPRPIKGKLLSEVTFPFEITATTKVFSLGTVVYDRPAYHTERYIYPVGYKTSRVGKSTTEPNKTVVYISEVLDNGDAPLFRVTTEDGSAKFEGATPTAPWSTILKTSAKLNNIQGRALAVSGPEMYLFSNQQVYNLMMQLPDIDKCEGFTRVEIKPRNSGRRKPKEENPSEEKKDEKTDEKKKKEEKPEDKKKKETKSEEKKQSSDDGKRKKQKKQKSSDYYEEEESESSTESDSSDSDFVN
ncbi:F/Y-rich N-terminus family protein [Trichomonas vaginalis G3]|uniref:F/Y-rich N-terminus family protein n=1 Tax=Trichomonas vaginalis (strain ATCC PRA-98 / G3) TaxID=412133 RepID=A2DJM5_TRIV3|nr:histone methyltransferase activity (H3-K4 specific) [Trichomonas vaginalis G3]EAY19425.1 F/Y-rich N-terminus family protein [Trichomonas vaginalis G3]KAI5493173.1 histone methyltransferase activity (H3-K4 specific) [Trichomonas vaginalis G3]|eukprot:XP_001580411.1 F/Y-rich N-terminus family protein [Trichomonas vaginalis G3]